jgi:hypothetical protein
MEFGIMTNVGIPDVTLTNTISVNGAVMALRFNMLDLILNAIEDELKWW